MMSTFPKLSLGPVLYHWPREVLLDFYAQIIDTPVEIVYLGETICSKRKSLRTQEWLELAQRLQAAGKEVVLSTLTLLEAESDLKTLRTLCQQHEIMVEANDMAAVHLLEGKPFITGPGINIYNPRTLSFLTGLGLHRWVFPVELSYHALIDLQMQRPSGIETEVLVYGCLPLAYSARCFTARAHNLSKDDCQHRCLDYPEGLMLFTQDHQPFLVLNGIQVQSACYYHLLSVLNDLKTLNVDVLRISPQSRHTQDIISIFHQCLCEPSYLAQGIESLQGLIPTQVCDGYWYGRAGIHNSLN